MAANEQEALSADIHLLGDLLGTTIRRLAGDETYHLIEEVRAAAKTLRSTPEVATARALRDRLSTLDLPELRALVRAFSIYFDLINLAEQRARVRALRARGLGSRGSVLAETPESALRKLKERGIDAVQVEQHLERAMICPVFTAHPSEARRRTILEKLAEIARRLDELEQGRLLPDERDDILAAIAEEVESLWLSDTIRSTRPTVLDEVRQGAQLVEASLLQVVPRLYREIEDALGRVFPERNSTVPPFLRFGSWIGGDRDGHPAVTPRVTVEAVRLQQLTLLHHYESLLDDLWRRLSHSERFVSPGPAFLGSLAEDAANLPEAAASPAHEPYRAKCRKISAKLRRTIEHVKAFQPHWGDGTPEVPKGVYLGPEPFLADLRLIADDLRRVGAEATANGALKDLIRAAEVFGVHLLTLDVRQHSSRHLDALDEIFHRAGVCDNYKELDPEARFSVLVAELDQKRPLIPARLTYSEPTNEVVETFRTMESILSQLCPDALHTYITSATFEPAHLLEVLLLAREAGLFRPEAGVSRIDVVPLFEAPTSLRAGAGIMERIFALPIYRRQLELRQNFQEIMLGYSDSNKEGGFLESSWSLYLAQNELAELGRRAGVTIQMFHGRGGAIGRGGGPANRAILAQPVGTINGRLRMTEQGEVISDRYSHHAIAERHLEQVVNAILLTSFPEVAEIPDPAWLDVLNRLATDAGHAYRSLVYESPEFLAYYEGATPIREISRLKIGSRPARRGTATSIEQLRAIPWVFSWMQSRHTLPGWYGLGSAVSHYLDRVPGGLEQLQVMYRRWPFWGTLVDNAQMILAKADMTIARLYADLVADAEVGDRVYNLIAEEYRRTRDVILRITAQDEILERHSILLLSIQRRNPYVDPLSILQLVMLSRLRSADEPSDELVAGVLESINGVASGLKNTG